MRSGLFLVAAVGVMLLYLTHRGEDRLSPRDVGRIPDRPQAPVAPRPRTSVAPTENRAAPVSSASPSASSEQDPLVELIQKHTRLLSQPGDVLEGLVDLEKQIESVLRVASLEQLLSLLSNPDARQMVLLQLRARWNLASPGERALFDEQLAAALDASSSGTLAAALGPLVAELRLPKARERAVGAILRLEPESNDPRVTVDLIYALGLLLEDGRPQTPSAREARERVWELCDTPALPVRCAAIRAMGRSVCSSEDLQRLRGIVTTKPDVSCKLAYLDVLRRAAERPALKFEALPELTLYTNVSQPPRVRERASEILAELGLAAAPR